MDNKNIIRQGDGSCICDRCWTKQYPGKPEPVYGWTVGECNYCGGGNRRPLRRFYFRHCQTPTAAVAVDAANLRQAVRRLAAALRQPVPPLPPKAKDLRNLCETVGLWGYCLYAVRRGGEMSNYAKGVRHV